MDIQDLRQLAPSQQFDTDLCIIGSGPAGLTIAGECIATGLRTLIVESGGLAEEPETSGLNEIESIGAPREMDHRLVRNRVFGGTSKTWTGRCAPFEAIDFTARDWVPFSGWPIARDSIETTLDRAGRYLGLGPNCYDERLWGLAGRQAPPQDLDANLLRHCFWQYSNDVTTPLDYMRFGPAFLARAAPQTRILLHATVTQLQTNDAGTELTGVEVAALGGNRATIRAKAVVLCAGGIENARIMLYSTNTRPAGVGNAHGLVGRFLMDHPRCTLAEFDIRASGPIQDRYGLFRLGDTSSRHFFVQGIALSPEFQRRASLLNCAAWLTEDRALDDPWDAAKRLLSGRNRRIPRDAWAVLSQPSFMVRGLNNRLRRGRGVPHKLQRLVLDCIVEQRPDPYSRVLLSERRDSLGLPVARLDWRISDQEKATVAAFGALIRDEFARIGLPGLKLADWVQNRQWDQACFRDVAHPAGTTRMASDPASGVVDADCQVHGVAGLFIAGSSVFPTSGHANPTLMIVALAIRLADHLKQRILA